MQQRESDFNLAREWIGAVAGQHFSSSGGGEERQGKRGSPTDRFYSALSAKLSVRLANKIGRQSCCGNMKQSHFKKTTALAFTHVKKAKRA
jgi:hypothetical protein